MVAVNEAFLGTSRGLAPWADPHPDRSPGDEEYSRLTNPQRWRIIGARAEAWFVALEAAGLAIVKRSDVINWATTPGPVISRTDRLVPLAVQAIPLVLARSGLGDVDDAGVVLGVGDPAVEIERFPDCGCDACDSGSQDELENFDAHLIGVVTGKFRRLSRRDQMIMTLGDGWRASGRRRPPQVDKVMANSKGWDEITGASWLSETQ